MDNNIIPNSNSLDHDHDLLDNDDDALIRDGRDIVDSIVASLSLHHASSSPEHRAEWDELLRMQNTPSPRQLQTPQSRSQQRLRQHTVSSSSRSAESANSSPHPSQYHHQHQHSMSSRTSSLQAMVQPETTQGGAASGFSRGSPASNPIVGERSSSIFATSPSRRRELSRAGSSGGGRDGSSSSAPPRMFTNENSSSASSSRPRRLQHIASTEPTMLDSSRSRTVEKDSDDPSTPIAGPSHGFTHTPTSLTKLLGANMAISPIDSHSRQSSYNQGNANLTRRTNLLDGATLPDHLYTQGLLGGRHSDIRILAFGNEYNLHRLILDRAPFFTLALSEPWSESKAEEIVLQPDLVDQAITQNAFELALKRLYGCDISDDEDAEAIGLFATGCWLEMQELIDSSVESILRQMEPENLSLLIKLVTNNYYGRPGERILSSAKAMLCRDGWDMSLKHWDAIPGRIVNEVVSSDGFYVYGEWERWNHGKKLFDRRLKQVAIELGMLEPKQLPRLRAPSQLVHDLARFSPHAASSVTRPLSKVSDFDDANNWYAVYLHADVESIADLLDSGIHYLHMDFEHLQYIKQSRDVFGLPAVPDAIISSALFQQLELRQRVVNAQQTDLELGLTQSVTPQDSKTEDDWESPLDQESTKSSLSTQQAEMPALPRFWIPSEDCTMVTGGTPDPIISLGSTSYSLADTPSRQTDLVWANAVSQRQPQGPTHKSSGNTQAVPNSSSYSTMPPFRFSAEFPSPRLLKEKKRVYSRTVFYAGSYWNIYIQKMRSVKQNYQLGVYLHRAKDREQDEVISTGPNFGSATVDERIGSLEREMLMRGGDRAHLPRHTLYNTNRLSTTEHAPAGSSNAAMQEFTRDTTASAPAGFLSANTQDRNAHSRFSDATLQTHILFDSDSEDEDAQAPVDFDAQPDQTSLGLGQSAHNMPFVPPRTSTLPSYTDTRPTIRTYFKIYSPSKAGRLLSVYESAPDQFDFSQSWGWRSSTLMLDEGFGNEADEDPLSGIAKKNRNGALRFSVVIGNL